MTQRLRSDNFSNTDFKSKKMGEDLSPGKTVFILVIVVGCFAVLCPNVFYPMLFGSPQNHIKPSPIDRTTGCCDVISETDVNTIRIMSELCSTIIKTENETQLSGREIISQCQKAVLETCGIDISAVLQERVILGHTTKQILDEIRSLNGSLCLKYNFGVSPWRLGVPHRVTVNVEPSPSLRQERPSHLRSEMIHPAFKERGRAIPTQQPSPSRPPPRIVEGKPGPLPGMRPTIGGAGKVVPPPKQTTGTMGLIMPIYTTGIVILFTYTVMKVLFKKQQSESLYPPVEPDPVFRREVFEANRGHSSTYAREPPSNKLVVNAMSALLDQVDKELASRTQNSDIEEDITANGNVIGQEDQGSVKILGMEMTASCEGNKKWSGSDSPVLPSTPTIHPTPTQPRQPPHEIYLEGSLPPQSNHLLVADSAIEAQEISTEEDPAVVLAGKMTLSVLSLDSENGTEELHFDKKIEERSSSNVSEDFEKIDSGELLRDQLNEVSSIENEVVNEINNETHATISEDPKENLKPIENIMDNIEIDLVEKIDKDIQETVSNSLTNANILPTDTDFSANDDLQNPEKTITDIIDLNQVDDIELQTNVNEDANEEEQAELKEILKSSVDGIENDSNELKARDIEILENTISKSIEEDLNKSENIEIHQILKGDSISNGDGEEYQNEIQIISDNLTPDTQPTNSHLNSDNSETQILLDTSSDVEREVLNIIETSEIQPESIEVKYEQRNKELPEKSDNDLVIEHSNDVNATGNPQDEPCDDTSSNEFEKVDDDIENEENIENDNEEYEYELSDEADIDEEIQNVERLDHIQENTDTRVNGDDHGQLKEDTFAENLGSDEEVEEIIEYVTDEEEEEEEEEEDDDDLKEEGVQHNNIGHNSEDVN